MLSGSLIGQIVLSLASQMPTIATWIFGGVLAVVLWRRDPRGSSLVLLSCLICLAHVVIFGILYRIVPTLLQDSLPQDPYRIQIAYAILSFAGACLHAVAWILLLVAAFRQRPAA